MCEVLRTRTSPGDRSLTVAGPRLPLHLRYSEDGNLLKLPPVAEDVPVLLRTAARLLTAALRVYAL